MSFPYVVPLTPKEVITTGLNQICPLGTAGRTADGRSYRYAKNGTVAISKGLVAQGPVPTNPWDNATFSYLSTAAGAVSITSTYSYIDINTTNTGSMTVAANFFKEGYLWVSSSSTESGQMIKIKSHTASSSATAGQYARFTMDDGYRLSQTIDSGSFVSVTKNLYDGVVVTPTALTGGVVGVPNCDVAASTTAIPVYFWLQTWGPCPVKSGDAITIGMQVTTSTQVDGHVDSASGTTELQVGNVVVGRTMGSGQTTSEFTLVHLTLEP